MDESDEHDAKAELPIRKSFESRSNLTTERDLQSLKQKEWSRTRQEGSQVDESDEHD
jgi:hypothetical protein